MAVEVKPGNLHMVRVDELVPYENNPRVNDHAVKKMAQAIREFGFVVPVLTVERVRLVNGHLSWKGAMEAGLEEIPAVSVDGLTESQVKALRISVNRMSEEARWDYDKLREELEGLQGEGFDLELTSLSEDEIKGMMEGGVDLTAFEETDGRVEPVEAVKITAVIPRWRYRDDIRKLIGLLTEDPDCDVKVEGAIS